MLPSGNRPKGADGDVVASRQHNRDRDAREDAEGRRETVQVAVWIVDRKPHGIVVVHALASLGLGCVAVRRRVKTRRGSSRPALRAARSR